MDSVEAQHRPAQGDGQPSAKMPPRSNSVKEAILYDTSGQAPAPSRNYYQVLVTEMAVMLRWWPISFHAGSKARPGEKRIVAEDYEYDTNLRTEIKHNLGEEVDAKVARLARGIRDPLSCLPRELLNDVLDKLDLQSLQQLGKCNTYLRDACCSNDLWERIYRNHHNNWVSQELQELAAEISWKKVFFTSKLQIQLMLSRRRRASSAKQPSADSAQSSAAFVTEMNA